MNKLTKYILTTICTTFMLGTTAFAADEITVTEIDALMNTMDVGIMYTAPDENSVYMTAEQLPDGVTVHVTGLTSNKYWVADVGAGVPYYFNYEGLISANADMTNLVSNTSALTLENRDPVKYPIYEDEWTCDGQKKYNPYTTDYLINSEYSRYNRIYDDNIEWYKLRLEAAKTCHYFYLYQGYDYYDCINANNLSRNLSTYMKSLGYQSDTITVDNTVYTWDKTWQYEVPSYYITVRIFYKTREEYLNFVKRFSCTMHFVE